MACGWFAAILTDKGRTNRGQPPFTEGRAVWLAPPMTSAQVCSHFTSGLARICVTVASLSARTRRERQLSDGKSHLRPGGLPLFDGAWVYWSQQRRQRETGGPVSAILLVQARARWTGGTRHYRAEPERCVPLDRLPDSIARRARNRKALGCLPIPMKPRHCSEMIAPPDSGMISPLCFIGVCR